MYAVCIALNTWIFSKMGEHTVYIFQTFSMLSVLPEKGNTYRFHLSLPQAHRGGAFTAILIDCWPAAARTQQTATRKASAHIDNGNEFNPRVGLRAIGS